MPLFPHPNDPLPAPAPVRCAADALRVVRLALTLPPQPETLAFLLDDQGVGGVITLVSGTTDPDAVLAVTECLARAAQVVPRAVALVLATVRPGGGVEPGDVDRWLEASHLAAQCDIVLFEWFVIGSLGVSCPRDLLGEPERWGQPEAQVARRRSAG